MAIIVLLSKAFDINIFMERRKILLVVEFFLDWCKRFFATRLFWHALPQKQTYETHVRIRWKWPPQYTGKHCNQKCRTFMNGIIMKNQKFKKIVMQEKDPLCNLGQDNVWHFFKPESTGGAGYMTVFIPMDWSSAGHGMLCSVVRMRTTVLGCISFGDTAIRCHASQCIQN